MISQIVLVLQASLVDLVIAPLLHCTASFVAPLPVYHRVVLFCPLAAPSLSLSLSLCPPHYPAPLPRPANSHIFSSSPSNRHPLRSISFRFRDER